MRSKILLFLPMLLLLVSVVSAFNYTDLEGSELPSEISGFIGNQKVNVFLDDLFMFSVLVEDGKVFPGDSLLEKASLEVYITNETISRIESSEDPVSEALKAYKSGEIKVIKKTLMNKIKFFFAKFFI